MRIHLLTPGTGHFYCGSCLRDNTLARGLRALGHDAVTVPLYLPLMLEDPSPEEADEGNRVHMGGINMYLQQKLPIPLPQFLQKWLNRPGLLRWAAQRGNMTDASKLGAMTLSMLRGESGKQAREVDKLVNWMGQEDRPEVIILSNIMLIGAARKLKQALDVPIITTLQGEAPFLDALNAPYAERAWNELRDRTKEVDAFVPVSNWYGELMRERLSIPKEKVHVVHNGIDVNQFVSPPPAVDPSSKTIGYLARMCPDKGLDTLVDAFLELKRAKQIPGLKLHIGGVMLREDRPYVDELKARIHAQGHEQDAKFSPNLEHADKLELLHSLSAFSVPARYGESFGLYLLEAMATGVPVVQPRHAAFPEILAKTGGILCDADDHLSLARALEKLLTDEEGRTALAKTGKEAILEYFSSERMAREVTQVCRILTH